MKVTKYGIDEAGRGPIAGPVSVAVFGVFNESKGIFDKLSFPRNRDSKKMSEEEREGWFTVFEEGKKKGIFHYECAFSSADSIDKKGIVMAIKIAMEKCLTKLECDNNDIILLDGSLTAPFRFKKQKTIIKGDEKEVLIACASIVAKVSRDRMMKKIAKKYPDYLFDIHKGYGTAKHREVVKEKGVCSLHRKSFCKNLGGSVKDAL